MEPKKVPPSPVKQGRPPKYKNREQLDAALARWVAFCTQKNRTPSKANLCLLLEVSHDTIDDMSKLDEFRESLSNANLLIEEEWTQILNGKGVKTVTGSMFYLKNAFRERYRDTHQNEVTVTLPKPIMEIGDATDSHVLSNDRDQEDQEIN